jgi:hypothetical protein
MLLIGMPKSWCSEDLPTFFPTSGRIEIDRVAARRVDILDVFRVNILNQIEDDPAIPSRSYRPLKGSEIDPYIKEAMRLGSTRETKIGRDGFFNVWSIDEVRSSDKNGVVLEFVIEVETGGKRYLEVGADFAFAVLLNNKGVYGRSVYYPYREANDLVELNLSAGKNLVSFIGFAKLRRSPRKYFEPQWAVKMAISGDISEALSNYETNYNRIVDTPIMGELNDVRCNLRYPIVEHAKVYKISGELVAEGTVDEAGSVNWSTLPSGSGEPILIISIDNRFFSPIILTHKQSLDHALGAIAFPKSTEAGFWKERMNHLLKNEFSSLRNSLDWNEKIAKALSHALLEELPKDISSKLMFCYPGLISGYVSDIDGSNQFILVHRSRNLESDVSRPLIVICPTVTSPVRPFVQSIVMSSQREFENWCAVADKLNCDLLWPGYNEVDFGGPVSNRQLHEAITAYRNRFGTPSSLNLYAPCSAGVGALTFSACSSSPVDAILFHSPIVTRRVKKFAPGLKGPASTASDIAEVDHYISSGILRLKTSFTLLSDAGIPGHGGDSEYNRILIFPRERGYKIERPLSTEFLWGDRMKSSLNVLWSRMSPTDRSASISESKIWSWDDQTVKATLLKGFVIRSTSGLEGVERAIIRNLSSWRGSELQDRDEAKVVLNIMSLDSKFVANRKEKLDSVFKVESRGKSFVVLERVSERVVHLFVRAEDDPNLFTIDPILDGEARLVVFEKKQGEDWSIIYEE